MTSRRHSLGRLTAVGQTEIFETGNDCKQPMITHSRLGFSLMAWAMLPSVDVRGNEPPLPDLTQGTEGIDRSLTYNLGATGTRGWIHTPHWPQNIGPLDRVQGRTTGSSRQILVTHVGEKSPADGVMKVDDVILGIDDQPFTADARKSLAKVIQEAEKEPPNGSGPGHQEAGNKTRSGHLVLLRWREGKTEKDRSANGTSASGRIARSMALPQRSSG